MTIERTSDASKTGFRYPFRLPLFTLAFLIAATDHGVAAAPSDVSVRNFFGAGVTFDRPIMFAEFPEHDSTHLVVGQFGEIVRVQYENNVWVKTAFDSVAVGIGDLRNNEDAGLLGFAFHPDYEANGKYYVYYVQDYTVSPRPGTIILAERQADSTRLKASGEAERVVLRLGKSFVTHNGGTMKFGEDGYLYVGLGDGGGAGGDPRNLAQNPGVLFGKMLRIDVDGPDAFPGDPDRNYGIPSDNPFLDSTGYLPEVWALGLRNPWKWDFHPETGEIWLGDVGHGAREEVTLVPPGANLGWKIWEGFRCFTVAPCSDVPVTFPLFDLTRSEGISVTGGTFYTENEANDFYGLYIFGDYGFGTIWSVREEDGVFTYDSIAHVPSVVSFDRDSQGRIFVVSLQSGIWNDNGSWSNTGTIRILESPDLNPSSISPPSVRNIERPVSTITLAELKKSRNRYVLHGLDGRKIEGIPQGVFWVRNKDGSGQPRLLHNIRGAR